jgi:hypothetical protein
MGRRQGWPGAQAPAAGTLAQGDDPGHVARQETHQPRGEDGLAAAEQGHIARAAEGKGPLRRAVAADHQHRHQPWLGQPALPIVSCRREKRVSTRKDDENDGCPTDHTAPP